MLELIKIVDKKRLILLSIVKIINNLSVFGVAFAFKFFVVEPLVFEKLIYLLISLLVLYVIRFVSRYIDQVLNHAFFTNMKYDIERYYFDKITKMNINKFIDSHTGYIHNMVEKTAYSFYHIIDYFLECYLSLIIGFSSLIYATVTDNTYLSIIIMLFLIIPIVIKYFLVKKQEDIRKEYKKLRANSDAILIDFTSNLNTVRKLGIEKFAMDTIKKKGEEVYKKLKEGNLLNGFIGITYDVFTYLTYIFLVVETYNQLKMGNDALAYFMFYFTIIKELVSNMSQISRSITLGLRFRTDKMQIDECIGNLDYTKKIKLDYDIEIRDGLFFYKDRGVKVKIPNFKLQKGDKVSVMGPSGEGKTTILNILYGMYELKDGKMYIKEKEVKNKKLDVVYISQEVDLFDLTIRENLTLGENISDEKILELINKAGLYEWFKNLPNGLDEYIGERGVKLSAGQRQRLNIIRGILKDNDVYFFDEPTSNLDVLSEEKIIELIDEYLKDKTYIIVTHREKIKNICNKHYILKNHVMQEV